MHQEYPQISSIHTMQEDWIDDRVWTIGWAAALLANGRRCWILIGLVGRSRTCAVLRAHSERETSCIIADLNDALHGRGRILHALRLSTCDSSFVGKQLENWALPHGIVLHYYPSFSSCSAIEVVAQKLKKDIEKTKPRTLNELNEALTSQIESSQ